MKLGIIGDIHSNFSALTGVWPKIKHCPLIVNVGDFTGYYADVNQVIDLIRKNRQVISLIGNHDRYLLDQKIPANVNPHIKKPFFYNLRKISKINYRFLKKQPTKKILSISGLKIGLFHGSPQNPDEYLYPNGDFSQFKKFNFDLVILGHTHWPMIKKIGRTTVVNPGSVGQPRDDDKRAAYAIINLPSKRVTLKRVSYSVEEVCQKVIDLGFDLRLATILKKEKR